MKKILMFLRMNEFSGAENVACQIIELLREEVEFIYVCPDGPIREKLKEKKINFFPLNKNSFLEYKRAIREIKPDIIHTHDMWTSIMAGFTCGKIPLILHIHNNAFNARKTNLKSLLFKIAANKAKHIFWVSESSFNGYIYHKQYKEKSSILYNIIDTEKFHKEITEEINEEIDIVYVGRLTYQKNPQRLITIMEELIKKRPETKMVIIGNGNLENEIIKEIREKGLEKNIKILGYKKNACSYINKSKVMLMTSRWEGTPMVCLESLALGVPIVSTPVDGILKIVKHGKNGFLSDDNKKLIFFMLKILEHNDLRKELSNTAIQMSIAYNNKIEYKEKILTQYNCIK